MRIDIRHISVVNRLLKIENGNDTMYLVSFANSALYRQQTGENNDFMHRVYSAIQRVF